MKRALYAGSFDPVTYGHLDILRRAVKLFDEIIVAVGENPAKHTLFPKEERMAMLREAAVDLENVSVEALPGLLVDFARTAGAGVIVRGLRAVSDFEAELQQASMNRALDPDVETVFLMTSPEYHYLSASIVREIAAFGGDVSAFVPPHVEAALKRRLRPESAAPAEPR